MARSWRLYIQGVSGRMAVNHNIAGWNLDNRSTVFMTAAPCAIGPPGVVGANFDPNNTRLNVHGPDIRVSNVVPHPPEGTAGGVEFVLTVNSLTDVAVTITLLDEPWEGYHVTLSS